MELDDRFGTQYHESHTAGSRVVGCVEIPKLLDRVLWAQCLLGSWNDVFGSWKGMLGMQSMWSVGRSHEYGDAPKTPTGKLLLACSEQCYPGGWKH